MTGSDALARPSARRIGVFGGSFDPVHQAHLALGRLALDALQLDELRWVPVGQPWQKVRQLADSAHREAMLRLALNDGMADPRHRLEPLELQRQGPSYTQDTLQTFTASAPGCEWFLIIGQDQYANLHTWHGWQKIVSTATLAVAARAGLLVHADPAISSVPHRVVSLPLPAMPVSSTTVREHLSHGGMAQDLVPAMLTSAVASYIDHHQLYRSPAVR